MKMIKKIWQKLYYLTKITLNLVFDCELFFISLYITPFCWSLGYVFARYDDEEDMERDYQIQFYFVHIHLIFPKISKLKNA